MRLHSPLLGIGALCVVLSPIALALNLAEATATPAATAATATALAPTSSPPPPLSVGSDGTDGALNVPFNATQPIKTIDLGLAYQAQGVRWDTPVPLSEKGHGVYDPDKWAVVFKYTDVTIAPGMTVKFTNHPTNAPVVWLVSGSVLIEGTIDLSGNSGGVSSNTVPGPGGFRGGIGSGFLSTSNAAASGFGPGGGLTVPQNATFVVPVAFSAGVLYSNEQILPLIGGSGGTGAANGSVASGGAGGGAILIAANSSVTVNGTIKANGGFGAFNAGAGSGGSIRIVTSLLSGSGTLVAYGAASGTFDQGSPGRIRLEALPPSTSPPNVHPKVGLALPDNPPLIWLPTNGPRARIMSIGGSPAPTDPSGVLGVGSTDMQLLNSGVTTVLIECDNVPTNATVRVRVRPRYGNELQLPPATLVSGDVIHSIWSLQFNLPTGLAVFQVHATF